MENGEDELGVDRRERAVLRTVVHCCSTQPPAELLYVRRPLFLSEKGKPAVMLGRKTPDQGSPVRHLMAELPKKEIL
jgi:hypothetical protein